MPQNTFITWRYAIITLGVFCAFVGVFARLYFLQVVSHEELALVAEDNRRMVEVLHPRRGNIYGGDGSLLASTRPVLELGIDPQVFDEEDRKNLPALARLIGTPLSDILDAVELKGTPIGQLADGQPRFARWRKLADQISDDTYDKVRDLRIDGVYGNRKFVRTYPAGQRAAHILGFVNKEGVAAMGIERYLDYYLRGQAGWRETEKDGRRREVAQFVRQEISASDGLHVELTLDLVVQEIVESELERIQEKYQPKAASIIVSDATTGAILALANAPTFDPNEFWESPLENQRNRAVTDVYEPGSTFKIVAVSGALEEGIVTPFSQINCSVPVVEFRGRKIRLPSDHKELGTVPVSTVVQKSSNRGAAQLGMLLGKQRLYEYCRSFGFGEESGWGPGGEVGGILHEVKDWDGLTISRLPAGYAVGATPMQVHLAMSTIANDGRLLAPQIIRRVFDHAGNTVVEFAPEVRRQVVSSKTADTVARMLAAVTQDGGTATRAAIPGFEVAGKTGTARKIIDGRYSHQHHIASFTGFFPASDPEVVITVMVDDAQLPGPAYGGVVAAPSFRKVGESLIRYLSLRPAKDDEANLYAVR